MVEGVPESSKSLLAPAFLPVRIGFTSTTFTSTPRYGGANVSTGAPVLRPFPACCRTRRREASGQRGGRRAHAGGSNVDHHGSGLWSNACLVPPTAGRSSPSTRVSTFAPSSRQSSGRFLRLEAARWGSPSNLNGRHNSPKAFSQSGLSVGRAPLASFSFCPQVRPASGQFLKSEAPGWGAREILQPQPGRWTQWARGHAAGTFTT
jgi:hypothetical protein